MRIYNEEVFNVGHRLEPTNSRQEKEKNRENFANRHFEFANGIVLDIFCVE
jgi:hypothetical protein